MYLGYGTARCVSLLKRNEGFENSLCFQISGSRGWGDVGVVFWVVTSCGLVSGYFGFGVTYRLQLQGEDFPPKRL
jgi:hypothetical protein